MQFVIENTIFDAVPDMCVGVVVAKGVDNHRAYPEVEAMLDASIAMAQQRFADVKVKEAAEIVPYREAFRALGLNPNRFPCSVEAMFSRISKGKDMPHINALVDLNNAISLKHVIPMGTHDLGISPEDIVMRYSVAGDTFLPFGETEAEQLEPGEVIYAVGHQVRTRRWTWRQSEHGKITEDTSYVFFPIDGFVGVNDGDVKMVMQELANTLQQVFGCETVSGFVDKEHQSFSWEL